MIIPVSRRYGVILTIAVIVCLLPLTGEPAVRELSVKSVTTTDLQNTVKTTFHPGDAIRYVVSFSAPFFSFASAQGTVTFGGAPEEKLELQFRWVRAGDYKIFWDSIVPETADGNTTVAIRYRSIPGGAATASASFSVEEGDGPPPQQADYIGSSACIGCHSGFSKDVVDAYQDSGHHFALNAVSNNQPPAYPDFTPGISLPSVTNLLYTVGGYGWKANFVKSDGSLLTTGVDAIDAQYNLPNTTLGTLGRFIPYEITQTSAKPFDCGSCHTTGYSTAGNQGGLPGIVGTWHEEGVGCEACHGPGSLHVVSPGAVKPPQDPKQACTTCHIRDNTAVLEAEDGLVLSQQQSEELTAGGKFYFRCDTCHNAHASAHYNGKASGTAIVQECTVCHTDKTIGLGMQGLKCIDCHMPFAVKSAASISFQDPDSLSLKLGDVRSHLFTINTDANSPSEMFTADGKAVALGSDGRALGLTLNFVCLSCHWQGGIARSTYTFEQVKALAGSVHSGGGGD